MIDDERHPPQKNNKILWEIPEKKSGVIFLLNVSGVSTGNKEI